MITRNSRFLSPHVVAVTVIPAHERRRSPEGQSSRSAAWRKFASGLLLAGEHFMPEVRLPPNRFARRAATAPLVNAVPFEAVTAARGWKWKSGPQDLDPESRHRPTASWLALRRDSQRARAPGCIDSPERFPARFADMTASVALEACTVSAKILTVIVPTFNRSRFLARLLSFATEVRFPFHILIADSSGPEERLRNETLIGGHRAVLDVEHLHFDCGLMEKLLHAVEHVSTSYCCFWADDDFQLPEGLMSCLKFLEHNPNYGSCIGQVLQVSLDQTGNDAVLQTYPSREELVAGERLIRWSENFYPPFYAIYRKTILCRMLKVTVDASCYERCRIIPEILMGQVGFLFGLQKVLHGVSIVYQLHDLNDSRTIRCVHDHHAFPNDYKRYRDTASKVFSEIAGVSLLEADRVIDRSFRNAYYWTGGRGKYLKKIIGNLRSPWKKLQLRLDRRRLVPRFTRIAKEQISIDDSRLKLGSLPIAMRLLDKHPDGVD